MVGVAKCKCETEILIKVDLIYPWMEFVGVRYNLT